MIAESQLPLGLSFLNVYENPCCEKQDGLVDDLIRGLPQLKELDGNWVSAGQAYGRIKIYFSPAQYE